MTNFLMTNNNIDFLFGSIVLGSATVICLVGYTCYLGYEYYYNKPIIEIDDDTIHSPSTITSLDSPTIRNSSIILDDDLTIIKPLVDNSTQTISKLLVDKTTQTQVLQEAAIKTDVNVMVKPITTESSSQVSTSPNPSLYSTSVDAVPSINDLGIQTSDQLLYDELQRVLDAGNSDQESVSVVYSPTNFYSPLSPVTRYFRSIPETKDVSIQSLSINQDFNTPILSQLQFNIDSLNSFNSNITPITPSAPNSTKFLLLEDLDVINLTDLCLLFL